MSSSLFKKSLEILEGTNNVSGNELSKKKKNKQSAFEIMPENHKLLRTVKTKGKKKKYNELRETTKLSLEEAKEIIKSKTDKTEENVQKLLRLSSFTLNGDQTDKLFRRAKTNHYVIPEEKKDVGTAFTEEDFKNFEKDFFCT